MMDDTNLLSDAESKYFDSKGEAELPLADTPETVVKETEVQRVETKIEPVKEEAKAPTEIEVVNEDDADKPEHDPNKYVKLGVLRREREAKKALRGELQAAHAQIAAFQARQQEPPRQLTPEEVPQEALQRVQNLERSQAEREAKQNFVNAYAQKAQEFARENDDFPQAYQYALKVRGSIYEAAGFPPQQIAQLLESEEASIAERAFMEGKNPAAVIYDIAQKLGYQKAVKVEAKSDPVAEQVNTQAKTADKTLEAAKHLEKIAKGMEKNKTLTGGGGGNDEPSLEELAMMDEDAFTKATSGKKWQGLMGG